MISSWTLMIVFSGHLYFVGQYPTLLACANAGLSYKYSQSLTPEDYFPMCHNHEVTGHLAVDAMAYLEELEERDGFRPQTPFRS